jgi:cation transport regulator ChaB
MPYSKISDLPKEFDGLPDGAKEIALNVINEVLKKDGATEESAFKQAWGAVKKSYKKNDDGTWAKLKDELETVDLEDVEILAVGKWQGSTGPVTFTTEDLDKIVDSYHTITADKSLNYEPPAKLGHADKQKLLQEDGYPAAGWVSSLKRVGEKLVATVKDVPRKIADIIRAGGYKKVSSEVYRDYEIGGKKYARVLKAIAFLGGDIPAVKTLNDIVAQYGENAQIEAVLYELAEGDSITKRLEAVQAAWRSQAASPPAPECPAESAGWICEVFNDYVIIDKAGRLLRIPYTVSTKTNEFVFDTAKAVEVEKVYHEIKNSEKEELMEKEIREVLGLAEDANVVEAVKALKAKVEAQPTGAVALTEHEAVKGKVKALETKLAERERDERVTAAIKDGKITPAQKQWAEEYAFKDPTGFDAFVKAASKVVELGERGTAKNGAPAATTTDDNLTKEEIELGEKLGVSKEDLIKAKK